MRDKGFWDGGAVGQGKNGETGGRPSGYPGSRRPARVGIKTDLEFPEQQAGEDLSKKR